MKALGPILCPCLALQACLTPPVVRPAFEPTDLDAAPRNPAFASFPVVVGLMTVGTTRIDPR